MKLDALSTNTLTPIHAGGAVLCTALLAAGWLFGLSPLMAQTSEDTTVVEQAERAQQDAERTKVGLDRLRARLDEVKADLQRQPVSLSSADQINPLLAQLAEWSETHELSITQTRAGTPIALMYYDYVPISLEGEGQYSDFLALLRELRTSRKDLGVVSFDAKRVITPAGPGIGFSVELAWYVIADDDNGINEQEQADTPATALIEVGR